MAAASAKIFIKVNKTTARSEFKAMTIGDIWLNNTVNLTGWEENPQTFLNNLIFDNVKSLCYTLV